MSRIHGEAKLVDLVGGQIRRGVVREARGVVCISVGEFPHTIVGRGVGLLPLHFGDDRVVAVLVVAEQRLQRARVETLALVLVDVELVDLALEVCEHGVEFGVRVEGRATDHVARVAEDVAVDEGRGLDAHVGGFGGALHELAEILVHAVEPGDVGFGVLHRVDAVLVDEEWADGALRAEHLVKRIAVRVPAVVFEGVLGVLDENVVGELVLRA